MSSRQQSRNTQQRTRGFEKPMSNTKSPSRSASSKKGTSSWVDRSISFLTAGSRLEHNESNQRADYTGWRIIFNPVASYWGLVISVVVLTIFGLVMVFSSSTAKLAGTNQSVWSNLLRQGSFAVMGAVLLVGAQFLKASWIRRLSTIVMFFALVLQALTLTPLGSSAGGNTGWLILGPLRFQPAEILKFALCLWLPHALLLAKKEADKKRTEKFDVRPYLSTIFGFAVAVGLVGLGKDLGTAIVVGIIIGVSLLISGFPLKYIFGVGIPGIAIIFLIMVRGSSNRWARIQATYGGCSTREASQSAGICFQSLHGDYALATGGLTGVGLGNSREKSYLPAQDNDYIFAIIGEELGFLGALVVILFIVIMAWSIINLSLRHQNIYMQMVLMCIGSWFAAQSFINIAVVLGILPVMGLPLPFISAGGSALVMCLAGAGVCIRFAREQEDVRSSRIRR
ncbi:cell division protein FtsW [Alloscardovia theropitheci]|uniref:Probable peptidoglycan glycosyltransferase FtsW n=1 Tax=Alloscardovia theropitheci TaxID=2496842 RepID=A0A4R0QZC8_9BIFI|nr:putative peptidoglycan glycosyltransferase FtsW [Alloscardovia theropitheci]TCD53966.1 cell division protein FtsW [Alloscardovia theropitheci]